MGTSSKRRIYALIARKKVISLKNTGLKAMAKKVKVLNKWRDPKKKKGKEKENAAEENSSDRKSDELVAFINYDCVAFIKDSPGAIVIIDTGASSHMIPHQNLLQNYQSFPKPSTIRGANKGTFNALGIGHLKLTTWVGEKSIDIKLKDTLYAPKITFTLISISQCNNAGYHTKFAHQKCVIKSATGKTLLQAPKLYGLYCLDNELAKNQAYQSLVAISQKTWVYFSESTGTFVETQHDLRRRAQPHWRQDHLPCMYKI